MPKIYNQTILVPEVEKRWKIQTHQMKLDSLQRIWFCVRLSAQVNTYLYLISLHWIHNFELINSVNILEHKSNEVIYACVDSMTTITAKNKRASYRLCEEYHLQLKPERHCWITCDAINRSRDFILKCKWFFFSSFVDDHIFDFRRRLRLVCRSS